MPKISIITGYYNRQEHVENSIESLLKQSYKDFELIIFDDCSTDKTYERLQKFDDGRIILIRNESNIGFVNGLINSINICSGDYILVHGSGDYSFPTRVEKQVEVLDRDSECGMVTSHYQSLQYPNTISIKRFDSKNTRHEELLKHNCICAGNVAIRRSVLDLVGGYNKYFEYSQDIDLWLRISSVSKIEVIDEVLYERYTLFDGVSYNPDKNIRSTKYAILAKTLNRNSLRKYWEIVHSIEGLDIDELIPTSNRIISKTAFGMFFVYIYYGKVEFAEKMIKYVRSPIKRLFCRTLYEVLERDKSHICIRSLQKLKRKFLNSNLKIKI